ncbi:unnamed protein product [Closterium sp. NIES-53]
MSIHGSASTAAEQTGGREAAEHQEKWVREVGVRWEYAVVSGVKVNTGKSVVLPLGENVNKQAPAGFNYKWVSKVEVDRLLGVWVTPGGSAGVTWEKAFDKAAGVLSRWQSKYLTTGARVTIINSYVLPILFFQVQVYPPDDLLWKRLEVLLENFVSANQADTEKHFRLWSGGLIYAPREQGGIGVVDPRGRIDSVALRCVGLALLQGCQHRREVTEEAAGLPPGWGTLYAHKVVLKGVMIKSRRWAKMCKVVLKSTAVRVSEAASRKKEATMATRAFYAVPDQWREWLLAPMTAEEVAAVSPFVCKGLPNGNKCMWEVCGANGRLLELRGVNGRGECIEWDVKLELRCESMAPAKILKSQAAGVVEDHMVRLLVSALFTEEGVVPLRKLREPSKGLEVVEEKRARWEARAGGEIDWDRGRRIRDSLVVPVRAQDVLLRLHSLNLQVGERVYFLGGGVSCPLCGGTETLDHCLLECPHVMAVAVVIRKAIGIMNPEQ